MVNSWEILIKISLKELLIPSLKDKLLEFIVIDKLVLFVEGWGSNDGLNEWSSGIGHIDMFHRSDVIKQIQFESIVYLLEQIFVYM